MAKPPPKPVRKPVPRDHNLAIRISAEEDAKLSDLAMDRGVSRSDVVRGLIRGESSATSRTSRRA